MPCDETPAPFDPSGDIYPTNSLISPHVEPRSPSVSCFITVVYVTTLLKDAAVLQSNPTEAP